MFDSSHWHRIPCCSANCSARGPFPISFTAWTTVFQVRGRSPVSFSRYSHFSTSCNIHAPTFDLSFSILSMTAGSTRRCVPNFLHSASRSCFRASITSTWKEKKSTVWSEQLSRHLKSPVRQPLYYCALMSFMSGLGASEVYRSEVQYVFTNHNSALQQGLSSFLLLSLSVSIYIIFWISYILYPGFNSCHFICLPNTCQTIIHMHCHIKMPTQWV